MPLYSRKDIISTDIDGTKNLLSICNEKNYKLIDHLDLYKKLLQTNYIKKLLTLTKNIVTKKETDRFLKTVQNLRKIKKGNLDKLNIVVNKFYLKKNNKKGIF